MVLGDEMTIDLTPEKFAELVKAVDALRAKVTRPDGFDQRMNHTMIRLPSIPQSLLVAVLGLLPVGHGGPKSLCRVP
jgi:hypothetical protein